MLWIIHKLVTRVLQAANTLLKRFFATVLGHIVKSTLTVIGLTLTTLLSVSTPAHATSVSFTYTDASEGNLAATFTLNVVGGFAVGGTGTITDSYLPGPENLTLVASTSTGSSINTGTPSTTTFTWQGVPNSGGVNFTGDAVVNASAPYLDTSGLIFALVNPTTSAIVGGINIWANDGTAGSLYNAALAAPNGNCYQCYQNTGNGALSPVPVPAALPLLLSGMAGLGGMARRRKAAVA